MTEAEQAKQEKHEKQGADIKALFEEGENKTEGNEGRRELSDDEIKLAFIALEELLRRRFPNSRYLAQVLTFLEIAAMYALRLLKK